MIDGSSLKQLVEVVSAALLEHKQEVQCNGTNGHVSSGSPIEDREFVITPDVESQISRVQRQFDSRNLNAETAHFACTRFGGTFLRSHNCSPKAGYQLVIQIASRLYFGYQPPCWETVSMRHFHHGRVDILQAILPEVEEFCASALDNNIPVLRRRELFFEAAKAHTKNLTRVSQGRGFAGHLYALQEVLRAGEELPSLFTNPTYAKTRPGKIMTDCTDWNSSLLQEAGWVMPDPEHVWVHYHVSDKEWVDAIPTRWKAMANKSLQMSYLHQRPKRTNQGVFRSHGDGRYSRARVAGRKVTGCSLRILWT